MKRKLFIITIAAMLSYIGLIFFLCLFNFSDNGLELPSYFLGIKSDKIIHFTMFFPFPLICHLLFYNIAYFENRILLRSLIILASGALLALLSEYSQLKLTAYRSYDNMDLVADGFGLLSATAATLLLEKRLKRLYNKLNRL